MVAMKKITKLTPAQTARFGEWAEKWIAIGLSTEPADFDAATAAALRAYELCDLKRPMVVLRMGSPYAAIIGGAIAWAMLREMGKTRKGVRSQVESQVWSQVESQVESQVRSQVESQVESQVWSQVWSQVGSQVRSQVRSQVESQVRSQVESQVRSQVESQVRSQVGGQVWSQVFANSYHGAFWASFGAYVSFLRDVAGWDDPVLDRFRIDEDLIKNCGWVWWHENVLAISDRPEIIRRDDAGRLHSESSPSIAYRDGWALWHWHGIAVPEAWVVDKAALTPEVALGQDNLELRRAACEIVGWDRILTELGGSTIDRDIDPEIGELVEVNLPGSGKEKFLRVLCGTGRRFAIPVPREMRTALEANAWTYDLPIDLLKQKEVRT